MSHIHHICRRIVLCAVVIPVISCSCGNERKGSFRPVAFPMVNPPSMVTGQDRVEYILEHFWDRYLACSKTLPDIDTAVVGGVNLADIEEAVSTYAVLLGQIPLDRAGNYMSSLADKLILREDADTSSRVLEQLTATIQKYFYDPNSPLRDEDLYCPFARRMSECRHFGLARRDSFARDVQISSLNRRGTKAGNFRFSDRHGHMHSLYDIKADTTILFFSNPGCQACKEIIDALKETPSVSEKIASGRFAVLNIYIDEDISEWMNYMPIYPTNWYNGYDPDGVIRADELYGVRAIPSLYLLDADKIVLLKDTTLEKLMNNII